MSDYASAAERARRAQALVARLERVLARAPDAPSLQIKLAARQKLARQMGDALKEASVKSQVDLCNYRILSETGGPYILPHVGRSLLEYQNVFSQIYDALRNGAKRRAVIGREVSAESALEFGYTYSGSLGVILFAPSERDFFEGKYDEAINAAYQVLDIKSQDDVRDIAKSLGEAVVKRVHDWSKSNVDGGFSVDLRWSRSDGKELAQVFPRPHMERIVDIISATSDEKTREFDVIGTLVGINIQTGAFQLSVPDDVGDYRGGLDDAFTREEAHQVPSLYMATIRETLIITYATNREDKKYKLLNLKPIV